MNNSCRNLVNDTNRKRFDYSYDILRFIAIITVVIGHSAYMAWSRDGGTIEVSTEGSSYSYYILNNALRRLINWIYGYHMPLFFILSGAVYSYSKNIDNFDALLKAKIKRLIVPYYSIGLIYMFPVKYISGFYTRDTFIPALESFLLGGCAGHFWFLIALTWVFAIFYFLEKYIFRKSLLIALGGACILYNLNLHSLLSFSAISAIPELTRALYYLPFFIGGYVFEHLLKEKMTIQVNIIVFVVTLILNVVQLRNGVFSDTGIKVIIGSLFLYSVSSLLALWSGLVHNKFFSLLRKDAFEIYLYHDPINFIVLKLANKYSLVTSNVGAFIFFLLRTIGVVAVSIFIAELVKFCKKRIVSFRSL